MAGWFFVFAPVHQTRMTLSASPADAQMDDDGIRAMACRFYGYGRWDAPHWFIGPEPGQGRDENNDLRRRAEAWLQLGGRELCDCREFHERICLKKWHGEKPQLQPTWRPLILLLMAFLEKDTDPESLRAYQRDRWGMVSGGETCVIELSGLPANSFKVPRDRKSFREKRIEVIRQRMQTYRPALVVMYGASEKEYWEELVERSFPLNNVLRVGPTIVAFAPHPTSRGQGNAHWKKLGETLRQEAKRS